MQRECLLDQTRTRTGTSSSTRDDASAGDRNRTEKSRPVRMPATRPTWAQVLSFVLQLCLVVGIELSDDITRGFIAPRPPGPALANAAALVDFEQHHGLWVEPAIQHYFEHTHQLLFLTLDWGRVVPAVNAVYGIAHGLVTLVFAAWIFWWKPRIFPFLRNVFLFATLLSVIGYNVFPVAPPRLAGGVPFNGGTYHFIDTVFVGRGVNLSFDQYAAMPSLHVAWALIVGLSMAWLVRSMVARVLWLGYPLLMSLVVIVTANHFIADCFGALAVVVAGFGLALAAATFAPNIANLGARRVDPQTPG